jgi:hypothetical protein
MLFRPAKNMDALNLPEMLNGKKCYAGLDLSNTSGITILVLISSVHDYVSI